MNIVKGLITSIDFNGNTCVVRLPLFESAANEKELLVTATFATQPGIYNGYKVNDVVYVAFENNEIDSPVVIGKLYLGADKESKDPRGAINAENLKSASPMTLPIDTHLTLDNDEARLTNVKVDGELAGYKTIADFARKLKKQDTKVGALNIQVIDDGKKIGNKVDQRLNNVWTEDSRTVGFGWDINDQRWRVYSSDSSRHASGFEELDILTVDPHGVTIMGDVKIVGYPTATLTIYAQTGSSTVKPKCIINQTELNDNINYKSAQYPISTTNLPIFDNTVNPPLHWQLESPSYISGKYIWEKTITFSYQPEIENGRKVVNEYWISTTVCISGSVGPKGEDGNSIASITKTSGTGEPGTVDTYTITYTKSSPTTFDVTNGADGIAITATKQWYKLSSGTPTKPTTDIVGSDGHTTSEGWSDIPLDAINGMSLWTSLESIFSDDTSSSRHITFTDPVKDATYALAQGKTTNYYSDTDPASQGSGYTVVKGDCWFDTSDNNYIKADEAKPKINNVNDGTVEGKAAGSFSTKEEYLKYFINKRWTTTPIYGQVVDQQFISLYYDLQAQGQLVNYYANEDPIALDVRPDSIYISSAQTTTDGSYIEVVSNCTTDSDYWNSGANVDTYVLDSIEDGYEVWERIEQDTPTTVSTIYLILHPITQEEVIDATYTEVDIPMTEVTSDKLTWVAENKTIAYVKSHNVLKQWDGEKWVDISGEIVENKVTANYINAMDITAKRIHVLDANNNTLFLADGTNQTTSEVELAGWKATINTADNITSKTLESKLGSIRDGAHIPYEYNTIKFSPKYFLDYHPFLDPDKSHSDNKSNWSMLITHSDVDTDGNETNEVAKFGIATDGSVFATSLQLLGGELKISGSETIDGVTTDHAFYVSSLGKTDINGGGKLNAETIKAIDEFKLSDTTKLTTDKSTGTPTNISFESTYTKLSLYKYEITVSAKNSDIVPFDTTIDVRVDYSYKITTGSIGGGISIIDPDGNIVPVGGTKWVHTAGTLTVTVSGGNSSGSAIFTAGRAQIEGALDVYIESITISPTSKTYYGVPTALWEGADMKFDCDLLPANSTHDLGSTALYWNNLYTTNIYSNYLPKHTYSNDDTVDTTGPIIEQSYTKAGSDSDIYAFPYNYMRAATSLAATSLTNGYQARPYNWDLRKIDCYTITNKTDDIPSSGAISIDFHGFGFISDYQYQHGKNTNTPGVPASFKDSTKYALFTADLVLGGSIDDTASDQSFTSGQWYIISLTDALERIFNTEFGYIYRSSIQADFKSSADIGLKIETSGSNITIHPLIETYYKTTTYGASLAFRIFVKDSSIQGKVILHISGIVQKD